MPDRFVHAFKVIDLDPQTEAAELAELKKRLPGRQARRMSGLGVLVATALAEFTLNRDTVVIYATTYTESRALESYLESFPHASPTHFQTSIHPGGIEQALILNQQAVAALYPLAGQHDILSQALALAMLEQREDVIIIAGEERGTWLTEAGVASDRSFVLALRLKLRSQGALALLHQNTVPGTSETPSLHEFAQLLTATADVTWHSPFGPFSWQWSKN